MTKKNKTIQNNLNANHHKNLNFDNYIVKKNNISNTHRYTNNKIILGREDRQK